MSPVDSWSTAYEPVAGSRLVTSPELKFKLARVREGAQERVDLLHEPASGAPWTVATIVLSTEGKQARASIRRLPLPVRAEQGVAVEVATLEHLYTLAIGQDPEARFCLAVGERPCDPSVEGYPHERLLRELVQARERALKGPRLPGKPAVAWQSIRMEATLLPVLSCGGRVGVRMVGEKGPMNGATVFFSRAPHSACMAKADAEGVAACDLVDQHPHAHDHPDGQYPPAVATFPGVIGADRVLPPTTLVLEAATMPSFGTRFR